MNRAFGHRTILVFTIVAGLVLGACSTTSPPSGGGGGGAGDQPSTAAGAGGGGAASVDACSLLTPAEIEQQVNVTVDNGLLQTTDTQASCDWNGPDGSGIGVDVTVQDFDRDFWSSMSTRQGVTSVSGYGDAAFEGLVSSYALSIKQGSYEIDVGVVNFGWNDAQVLAANEALAALVLSRV
jgi:Protein of unknown function (DUF3558)